MLVYKRQFYSTFSSWFSEMLFLFSLLSLNMLLLVYFSEMLFLFDLLSLNMLLLVYFSEMLFLFSLLSLNMVLLVYFSEMLFLFALLSFNLLSVLLNLVVGVHFFVRTKKRTKEKRNSTPLRLGTLNQNQRSSL